MLLFLFILANIGIFLGYMFSAIFIVPNFQVRLLRTKVGGPLFFLMCGFTHLELAVHAWAGVAISYDDFTSWHMLLVHIIQVIAVWMFVGGLYKEFRDYDTGRWPHDSSS